MPEHTGILISRYCAVIATSGPSATYPQRAYRNPLDALVNFLDSKHGANWCIWEFRAEGTGYPDTEVYSRIHHFPWPDHHPPPFALIPNIMGSMRNWLHPAEEKDADKSGARVAVVHCKAGKGRSGTIATGYLVSQQGWKKEDALRRFTERRMRVGFGSGVSIPSQLRYVGYMERWAKEFGKEYVERPVEVLEVHIWGLRDGVKVAVEGFVDDGNKIQCLHMFHRSERIVVAEGNVTPQNHRPSDNGKEESPLGKTVPSSATWSPSNSDTSSATSAVDVRRRATAASNRSLSALIFRPRKPIIVPGSDVNIDFERRSKASYTGFAMVTSVAHAWFNAYFEGGNEHDSGVFETEWEAMDGIKGTTKKGTRAFERLKVVWRYAAPSTTAAEDAKKEARPKQGRQSGQPKPGEPVHESTPPDWRGPQEWNQQENRAPREEGIFTNDTTQVQRANDKHDTSSTTGIESPQDLGLRKQTFESKDVSLAGSEDEMRSTNDDEGRVQKENEDFEGVRSYFARDGNGKEDKGSDANAHAQGKEKGSESNQLEEDTVQSPR